jgi:starvation-inducible DNA-binding protein
MVIKVAKVKMDSKSTCYCHLVQLLRDTSYLLNQTYIVHWNLMGGKFYSIHKLTQKIYEEMQDGLDAIAEHLRSLDISTPMTVEDLNNAVMQPIPESCFDQDGMIRALAVNNNSLAESFNLLAEEAEAMKDQLTLDLAIERGRVHKKFQWLLKSNLG